MAHLNITPRDRMVDGQGRPYFLWDTQLTLPEFEQKLRDPDPDVRAYFLAKLMRQARPDDVFAFVRLADITADLPRVQRHLGRTRAFWSWILETWGVLPHDCR